MANIRLIKRRIKSAKNIAQITRAMQMVAASKMRKAQEAANAGRMYAQKIAEMVNRLSAGSDPTHHPLLMPAPLTGKRLVVLLSTNKGLCGGLNTNLFRFFLKGYDKPGNHDYITIGLRGSVFLQHMKTTVIADFSGNVPFVGNVAAVVDLVLQKYLSKQYEGVDIVYNNFLSALHQEPKKRTIVPLSIDSTETSSIDTREYLIEPSVRRVFDALLPHYVENLVRDAILQAEASEHSARMVAMKNATDNALSLMDELTLVYNKIRQEKITYEISDIVTARLAVEN